MVRQIDSISGFIFKEKKYFQYLDIKGLMTSLVKDIVYLSQTSVLQQCKVRNTSYLWAEVYHIFIGNM